MHRLSVKFKIVALALLVGVFSITILGVYYFRYTREAMLKRTLDQLTSVRVFKKSQVEFFFSERIRNALSISSSLGERLKSTNQNSSTYARFVSDQKLYANYDFANLYLVDTLNRKVYASNTSDSQHYSNDLLIGFASNLPPNTTIYLHDIVKSNNEAANSPSACFIVVKDTLNALVWMYQIDSDIISRLGIQYALETGFGYSGEAYIVGSDYRLRTKSRFEPNAILRVEAKTKGVEKGLSGVTGTDIFPDYRGVEVISAFEPVNIMGLRWVVLAEIDLKEAMKPIAALRNDIVFLSLVISFFVFAISYIISRTISNPIVQLKRATESVAQGNFNVSVSISTTDEIGALAKSFNQMAYRINEITEHLTEREKRLNLFYNATTEGIIIHDKGRIQLVNQAMAGLAGKTVAELQEQSVNDIVSTIPKQGETLETVIYRGSKPDVQIELSALSTHYNGRSMDVLIARDITVRKLAEKALEEQQRKRTTALIDGQELERKRISRELHDGLGQKLIATKLHLESISSLSLPSSGMVIEKVKGMFAQLIAEVRQISSNLRPPALGDLLLCDALLNLCNEVSLSSGIKVNFACTSRDMVIGERTATYLYRIVQEALNNTVKHSKATQANVELMSANGRIILVVEDNGTGFNPDKKVNLAGNGIYNMRERTMLLGGNFVLESGPSQGTAIRVVLQNAVK